MEEERFNEFVAENSLQKCPECGFAIQKIQKSCNYITCPSQLCLKKIIFCYLCGQKLDRSNIESHYLDGNTYAICHNSKNNNNQSKEIIKNYNKNDNESGEDCCPKNSVGDERCSKDGNNQTAKNQNENGLETENVEECRKIEQNNKKNNDSSRNQRKNYKFSPLVKRIFFVGLIGSFILFISLPIYGRSLLKLLIRKINLRRWRVLNIKE